MEWKTLVYIVSLLQNKQEGGKSKAKNLDGDLEGSCSEYITILENNILSECLF